jgi:hypothetical protein
MNHLFRNIIFFLVLAFAVLCVKNISAQKTSKSDAKKMQYENSVENKQFVFHAQTVLPLKMATRNITVDDYIVKISNDTLESHLPYFGQAYQAQIGTSVSALDFTSTNFSYNVTPGKNKRWNVIVNIKDKNSMQYSFIIFNNGNASLHVSSIERDPISFQGYITPLKN